MDIIMLMEIWFKRIIFVLLFAVFMDFLLPSTVMQRYVRLVFGMLLIFMMIFPITQLFHIDVNQIEKSTLQHLEGSQSLGELSSIYQKGTLLQQADQSLSRDAWTKQITQLLKNQ